MVIFQLPIKCQPSQHIVGICLGGSAQINEISCDLRAGWCEGMLPMFPPHLRFLRNSTRGHVQSGFFLFGSFVFVICFNLSEAARKQER
jgi:hypothetical protein